MENIGASRASCFVCGRCLKCKDFADASEELRKVSSNCFTEEEGCCCGACGVVVQRGVAPFVHKVVAMRRAVCFGGAERGD
jgi:hypothetical protein